MRQSTQESPVSRRNPFEYHPQTTAPQAPYWDRPGTVGAARAKQPAQSAAFPSAAYTGVYVAPLKAVPRDAKERALRRQKFLKKRQFSWLMGLQRAAKLVAVVALIFVLLPSAVQKKVYRMLPFSAPSVAVGVTMPLPVDYDYISSPFGRRWGRQHQGIDFAASVGEPIYAASAGTVIHSGWEAGYGKSVVIDHGQGMQTRYGHCSRLLVKVGEVIPKGGMIARVGSTGHSTGPHLHFEVIVDGVRKNPAWYFTFANTEAPHLANANGDDD